MSTPPGMPPQRPDYLRPVPDPGTGSEAVAYQEEPSGTPGLTPPQTRAHGSRFVTDVIVELGYLDADRVDQAISEARVSGVTPEALMVDSGLITPDQLSRAIAEQIGRAHV